MNILVVGSKGFVGSHAFNYFLSRPNYNVFGCDVIIDYNAKNYFLIDSSNADFSAVFDNINYHVCLNCSGAASVMESYNNTRRDFELNVRNVFLLLDSIKKYQPTCKFINLSSAAVYGNPESMPIKEISKVKPLSPYGYHKMQSEQICEQYTKLFNLNTCSLRIFSAFGVGLKKQLFWDLFKKCEKQKDILLFGTGDESRDFIYVDDIIQIFESVIHSSNFQANIYNVANGKEIKIHDAVALFIKLFNPKIKFRFSGENKIGDPKNWCADIQKIKELNYKQSVDFEIGIRKYIKWLKELN